jgi:hypothetical protein
MPCFLWSSGESHFKVRFSNSHESERHTSFGVPAFGDGKLSWPARIIEQDRAIGAQSLTEDWNQAVPAPFCASGRAITDDQGKIVRHKFEWRIVPNKTPVIFQEGGAEYYSIDSMPVETGFHSRDPVGCMLK